MYSVLHTLRIHIAGENVSLRCRPLCFFGTDLLGQLVLGLGLKGSGLGL